MAWQESATACRNIGRLAPMKKLREIHLHPGCLFAPVLIFFAVTARDNFFN